MEVKRFSKSPPLSQSPNMYTHKRHTLSKAQCSESKQHIPTLGISACFPLFYLFIFLLNSFRENWTMKITLINAHKYHKKGRKALKEREGFTEWLMHWFSVSRGPFQINRIIFIFWDFFIVFSGGEEKFSIGMPCQIIFFITWYI